MPETISVQPIGTVSEDEFDAQGNPVLEDAEPADVEIKAFAPQTSGETARGVGTETISRGVIYGYPGTVFLPTDLLTIRGDVWQVDGEIEDWQQANAGGPGGVVVKVKRST